MERRAFIKATSLAAVASIVKPAQSQDNKIQTNKALNYEHKPKPLPFKPSNQKGFSEKMLVSHWENNYGGSVKALNEVRKKLAEMSKVKDTPPYAYNDLKREHLMRTGSVVNHELYFENLGGNGKVNGDIQSFISDSFGSLSAWEEEFKKIGAGLGGGPGWVILGYNKHLNTLENYWSYDHMHGTLMTEPLLIMDMYEHSYQIDYGAAAPKYIDAFFNNINWDVVNKRMEKLV